MRSRAVWAIVVLVVVAAIAVLLMGFNVAALPEPGRRETAVSNKARRLLIRGARRREAPRSPVDKDKKASVDSGGTLYGQDCGMCHGSDGRGQTQLGRWMYPRAADLTSADVQSYSDQELFWIVQNGIRLTGMPGFGKVESEEHIWNLVDYVRTLPQASEPKSK